MLIKLVFVNFYHLRCFTILPKGVFMIKKFLTANFVLAAALAGLCFNGLHAVYDEDGFSVGIEDDFGTESESRSRREEAFLARMPRRLEATLNDRLHGRFEDQGDKLSEMTSTNEVPTAAIVPEIQKWHDLANILEDKEAALYSTGEYLKYLKYRKSKLKQDRRRIASKKIKNSSKAVDAMSRSSKANWKSIRTDLGEVNGKLRDKDEQIRKDIASAEAIIQDLKKLYQEETKKLETKKQNKGFWTDLARSEPSKNPFWKNVLMYLITPRAPKKVDEYDLKQAFEAAGGWRGKEILTREELQDRSSARDFKMPKPSHGLSWGDDSTSEKSFDKTRGFSPFE